MYRKQHTPCLAFCASFKRNQRDHPPSEAFETSTALEGVLPDKDFELEHLEQRLDFYSNDSD
jgi:hypothetical protein